MIIDVLHVYKPLVEYLYKGVVCHSAELDTETGVVDISVSIPQPVKYIKMDITIADDIHGVCSIGEKIS